MNQTSIEWTGTYDTPTGILVPGYTANPIKYRDKKNKVVWGCVKVSSGCANCYAESMAKRFGRGEPFTREVMDGLTPFLDQKEVGQMLTSRKISGKKVFVEDMSDLFGQWVPNAHIDRLFALFALRQDVTFQVLTKRADRMADWAVDAQRRVAHELDMQGQSGTAALVKTGLKLTDKTPKPRWPLPNVWLGVSCENQEMADARIPFLLKTPAAVRFLSCEPLLGRLDLRRYLSPVVDEALDVPAGERHNWAGRWPGIGWAILGGESGSARPCDVQWLWSLVEQCRAAKVPVFVKQLGSHIIDSCRDLPGREWPAGTDKRDHTQVGAAGMQRHQRIMLEVVKSGKMAEWPEGLRIRDFPGGGK